MTSARGGPVQVVRGSTWFILSVAVTAAGGFVAWALAARLLPQPVVGAASLLFASVMFVNFLTGMGLPISVAKFAHGPDRVVEPLWTWAVAYTTLASAIGSVGFLLVGPAIFGADRLDPLLALGPLSLPLFFVLINGVALAALADMRFVALRAWRVLVLRVVGFTLLRLPLLLLPVLEKTPILLLIVMAGPPALSGWVSAVGLSLRRAARRWGRLRPIPAPLVEAWRFASVNWVGTLAAQAPQFSVPLIVATAVEADVNAAFYLAWSIAIMVFLVPQTIGQVVLSEASRQADIGERPFLMGLALALPLMVIAALCGWLLAPLSTSVFGPQYDVTAQLLPVLCAAGIPWALTSICLSRVRALGSWAGTLTITGGFAIATLVPTAVLVRTVGVDGAAVGWLAGNLLAAVIALVATWALEQRRSVLLGRAGGESSLPLTLATSTVVPPPGRATEVRQ